MFDGVCKVGGSGCYKCVKTEHFCRDCTITTNTNYALGLIFFHYDQRGHKKADYPSLTAGAVSAPSPITLRIIDGREVKVVTRVVKSMAF